MGEKINAICPSHHAFPKYICAFLCARQKLYWGTLSYCARWCPPPPNSAPLTGPHCNPRLLYINLSHFSCEDFRMVHNFNKRKLLFCSACSGNNTNTHRTLGGCMAAGSYWHLEEWPQRPGQTVGVASRRLLLSLSKKMTSKPEAWVYFSHGPFSKSLWRF